MSGTKPIAGLIAAAMAASSLSLPAQAQGLGHKGGYAGPPVEDHPKIDEKAYKDALKRIPTPDKPYDPWGVARTSEPAKQTKKSN